MGTNYVLAAALASIVWASWVRRHTWNKFWESAATAALLCNGIGMLLASPIASRTLGRGLYHLLGQYNLNSWMAHSLCLAGTAAFALHMLIRLTPRFAWQFKRKVGLPLTLAVPLMLACLWQSDVTNARGDFAAIDCDVWLALYWMVFCATMLWLEVYLGLLLLAVRERSVRRVDRRLAEIYLVAVLFAIIGLVVRAVTVIYDDPTNAKYLWLFGSISVIAFSWGCAYSWHRKTDAWLYRKLSPTRRKDSMPSDNQ